jgi:hypothetical protein
MTNSFNSHQLKEMVDKMESYWVDSLSCYNVATSNTKYARRSLFAIIRDDDKRQLVVCDIAYKDPVESGFLFAEKAPSRKREIGAISLNEEKAIAARKIQRDKAAEERGGWTYDILSRPNQVWIPGPDY